MNDPITAATDAPADNSPWGVAGQQAGVWVEGQGLVRVPPEPPRSVPDPQPREPRHPHWSPVVRLDPEAARQLVTWCFDAGCVLDEAGVGELRPDSRFLCGYCGRPATLTTITPADGGKSAACPGHADRLESAYFAELARQEARASRRRRR